MWAMKVRTVGLVLLLTVMLRLTGCGGEDDSTSSGDEPMSEADADEEEEAIDRLSIGGSADDLSGSWAVQYAAAFETWLPIPFAQKATFVIVWLGRMELEETEAGIEVTQDSPCDLQVFVVEDVDFGIIFTTVSIDLIPARDYSVARSDDSLEFPELIDIYGADIEKFDNPYTDDLPVEDDDARVVDFESDDHPGFTARVTGLVPGEVYAALRWIREFDASVVDGDMIEGSVAARGTLGTINADPWTLDQELTLDVLDYKDVNRLRMVRIPSEMDCTEILDNPDYVFGDFDPASKAPPISR